MPRERGGVGGRGREELALLDAGNAMVAASAPRRDIAYNPQGRSRGDQQRRGTAGSWGPAHVAGTAQGPCAGAWPRAARRPKPSRRAGRAGGAGGRAAAPWRTGRARTPRAADSNGGRAAAGMEGGLILREGGAPQLPGRRRAGEIFFAERARALWAWGSGSGERIS